MFCIVSIIQSMPNDNTKGETIIESFISNDLSTQRYEPSKYDNEYVEKQVITHFKPPICHLQSKSRHLLDKELVKDLELLQTQDDTCNPLVDNVFGTNCELGKIVRPDMTKYYSSNVKFINDTKRVIKKFSISDFCEDCPEGESPGEIFDMWKELKTEKDFRDKYHYIDWDRFEFLNNHEMFLQTLSMYNLASPVMALLIPVMMSLVPFIIIKIRGIDLSLSNYYTIFKDVAKRHALGKIFTSFSDVGLQERLYMLVSVGIYMMSLYQNTQVCLKFYKNMYKIHDILFKLSIFIRKSIVKMKMFLSYTQKLKTYKKFNAIVCEHVDTLTDIADDIDDIHPFCFSYKKLTDMGRVLKEFFLLYSDDDYNTSISFAFGFEGYISNLIGIKENILSKKMGYGTLREKTSKKKNSAGITIEKAVYPPLSNNKPVKNNIYIKKDAVITGPNASGKTTILKTIMTNIILTQQYGCGFYKSCSFEPYNVLHCYLNVPDTSGRDSLFQSESRKCKKILDKIERGGPSLRHFCLFDELYSGTNPVEAVKCGYVYLRHLSGAQNIQYALTTHYHELCKKLDKHENVVNYKMDVSVAEDNKFTYKYTIQEGINEIDGGVEVLRQMNYPEHMLKNI
jgi:hypothetical protein